MYFMFVQNEFKVTERDFSMKEVTKALKENRVSSTCTLAVFEDLLKSRFWMLLLKSVACILMSVTRNFWIR